MGYDAIATDDGPGLYNVTLGTAYFQRMLNIWDGNAPLAIASYNAGSGNVRQSGSIASAIPRRGKDVLQFIEQILFSETKAYVQRVIENSVVVRPHEPE